MQEAGIPSWQFTLDVPRRPHAALYVRDALALRVEPGPTVPPPLEGAVPVRGAVLDDAVRLEAALEWPSWWDSVVAEEAALNLSPEVGARRAWIREMESRAMAFAEPPQYASLSDGSALRRALEALLPEADVWAEGPLSANRPSAGGSMFDDGLVEQVAQDVAFDRDVALDAVHGVALVLLVRGVWWARYCPGIVLCSPAATRDATTAHAALRAAFDSHLGVL